MTGSGEAATLRMRGAPHAGPKIHGGDRKGETRGTSKKIVTLKPVPMTLCLKQSVYFTEVYLNISDTETLGEFSRSQNSKTD